MGTMMETSGLFFMSIFLFAEDKFIIEEEVDNHNNNGVEGKGAGGEDEFVRKW